MITGMKNTVLDELYFSAFEFHLTGSRFFGNHNQNSDYDFIVPEDDKMEQFLMNLGFKPSKSGRYLDHQTSLLYHHSGDEDSKNGYHVQVTKNVNLKLRVRDFIKQHLIELHNYLPKNHRKLLWNALLAALND